MPRVRVLTFNIAHGRGLTPIQGFTSGRKIRSNLRRIAALIGKLQPDIVALQEIDERSLWAGNFDHLDYLRLHTGFKHAVFGINNRRIGLINLSYGNAVLSRFPILAAETVVFGQRRVGEKGFVYVELEVEGECIPLVNLHLHFSSRAHRMRQLDLLLTWLREKQRVRGSHWKIPPVVCGDFNTSSLGSDATSSLLSHLADYGEYALHPQSGYTFPSPLPRRTLDFVFLPPGCTDATCEIIRTFISDHRPVLVDFAV